jgi:non-ribosomal peptide synthetase component E (peptide arylation enzyme)
MSMALAPRGSGKNCCSRGASGGAADGSSIEAPGATTAATSTGRKKDIIKGGVNIASFELTNCRLQYPELAEAATVGVPDQIYPVQYI